MKPPFPLYLRILEALFQPRTDKNFVSLNLVPSKRKAMTKISTKLSKKSQKSPPHQNSLAAKTGPIFVWSLRRVGPAHFGGRMAKEGAGGECGKPRIYLFLWYAGPIWKIVQLRSIPPPNFNPDVRMYVLGIRTGLSAPVADRPYSGFSITSERTAKHMPCRHTT